MFWSKKKEKKTLDIKLKDVFSIIKSDYDEEFVFLRTTNKYKFMEEIICFGLRKKRRKHLI